MLDNDTGIPPGEIRGFDYDALLARFTRPLHLNRMDYNRFPLFGFLFFGDRMTRVQQWAVGIAAAGTAMHLGRGRDAVRLAREAVERLDTTGANVDEGVWSERCAGCGECIVASTEGICPIARCSKSILNGPCGGSQDGKCEVDPENLDCGWNLIYERLKALGRLDSMMEIRPPQNWSKSHDGGPRRVIREDVKL